MNLWVHNEKQMKINKIFKESNMLEKFLNKKVLISTKNFASARMELQMKGTVTAIDDNFIELDNDEVIAIKYIARIKSL